MKLKEINLVSLRNNHYSISPFSFDSDCNFMIYDKKGRPLVKDIKDIQGILDVEVLKAVTSCYAYSTSREKLFTDIQIDFEDDSYVRR